MKKTTHLLLVLLFALAGCSSSNLMAQIQNEEKKALKLIDTLLLPEVAEELEIAEIQQQDLEKMLKAHLRIETIELNRSLGIELTDEELDGGTTGIEKTSTPKSLRQQLEETLLPHQISRLKEIKFQRTISGGLNGTFGLLRIKDELKLTDVQQNAIREQARKIDAEIEKELESFLSRVKEIRKAGRKNVTDELSTEQKNRFVELVGEDFFPASDLAMAMLTYVNKINLQRRVSDDSSEGE